MIYICPETGEHSVDKKTCVFILIVLYSGVLPLYDLFRTTRIKQIDSVTSAGNILIMALNVEQCVVLSIHFKSQWCFIP